MNRDDVLLEILERMARLEAKLSNGIPSQIKDHEGRIRALERVVWAIVGAVGVLQLVDIALKVLGR